MTLSGTRPWVIAGVVCALLLVALSWVTVIGPTRSDASTLRADTAAVQQQNQLLAARTDHLRDQAAHQAQIEAQVRAALEALPAGPSMPDLNQQLARYAVDRGVKLDSISVATASASTTAPVAGATTTAATPSPGVVSVPVTIESTGPTDGQLAFLRDLQNGPRAVLVTSTSLSAVDGSRRGTSTLTVQFTVFAAALSAADVADLNHALGQPVGLTR